MSVSYCQRHQQTFLLGAMCPTCSLPENTTPKYSENYVAILYQDNEMLHGELIGKNEEIEAVNKKFDQLQSWKIRRPKLQHRITQYLLILATICNLIGAYAIIRLKTELSWWKCESQYVTPPVPKENP